MLNAVVAQYEHQLQQNPNEAEENFDRSVSLRKFRITTEVSNNNSMRASPRPRTTATGNMRGTEADGGKGMDKKRMN